MNVLQTNDGEKRFCDRKIILNMAKNHKSYIPGKGRSILKVSLPSANPGSTVLNDNKTQVEKHERVVYVGDVGQNDGSVSVIVECVYAEEAVSGGSSNVESEKVNSVGQYSTESRLLKCGDCGEEFGNKLDLLRHTKVHYGVDDNGCKFGDSFTVAGTKLRSREDESAERKKSYECNVCSKRFYRKGNLKVHESIHTGKRQCKWCKEEFICNVDLKAHEMLHMGEKPFQCDLCNKKFTQMCFLERHKIVHTGEKPFKCRFCEKGFTQGNNLKAHERSHTGEKPFMCSLCDKVFSRRTHLRDHDRIHTGEKPFKCGLCDKAFTQMATLREHAKVHTGEKPFKCKLCPKEFTTNTNLKAHGRSHTGERPFKCSSCRKVFSHNCSLKKHERAHHAEKLQV